MLSINGMSGSLSPQATAQANLLSQLQKLSSGKAINSAADNAAGLAQSSSFSVQLSSGAQAMQGIQNGISLLETAGGAVGQINDGLQRINELAVQAGSGALSASDRQSIQEQIGQIRQGIDQIVGNTQFNGQKLLDGSFNQSLQTGADAGQTQPAAIGNLSTSALGLAGLDVTTAAGQANALTALSGARDQVGSVQANLGASQSGLESSLTSLGAANENLAAARSRIADTDYASAVSESGRAQLLSETSLKALALYNSVQKSSINSLF